MRYLTEDLNHPDEAGYAVEDGVVVDIDARPNARRAYDEWTRFWPRTKEDLAAEEAAWAARSGPCIIIKERKTA